MDGIPVDADVYNMAGVANNTRQRVENTVPTIILNSKKEHASANPSTT